MEMVQDSKCSAVSRRGARVALAHALARGAGGELAGERLVVCACRKKNDCHEYLCLCGERGGLFHQCMGVCALHYINLIVVLRHCQCPLWSHGVVWPELKSAVCVYICVYMCECVCIYI